VDLLVVDSNGRRELYGNVKSPVKVIGLRRYGIKTFYTLELRSIYDTSRKIFVVSNWKKVSFEMCRSLVSELFLDLLTGLVRVCMKGVS
jgi:hypothetical protein